MSTATAIKKPIREAEGDQCVAFYAIGWAGYLTLLRLRGEHSEPRMVYLDGTVWLMSPSFPHERLKTRLDHFVTEVVVGLDIPCIPAGSTTFRRRARRGGIEGDHTYYLASEKRVRGKDKLHLKIDPPPDLAIEAVHSHDADEAIEVYRRFKVPEVWVCDEAELVILVLQPNGRYAKSATSASFPFLTAAEVYDWVQRPQTEPDTQWIKQLRSWVKRTLKRRVQKQDQDGGQEQDPTI
jgi:Uma2 family endonuclease